MTIRARIAHSALVAGACLLPAGAAAQNSGTTIQPGKSSTITRVATRGANFLQIGVGARALALGGATTASGNDLSALYWNVAGVADADKVTGFASYEQMYGNSGLTNTFVGAVVPAFGGTFGLSFNAFTSGDMTRTTEFYPEGDDPTAGATVAWNATAVGVHYARPFTDRLTVGATLKRADEGVDFARATYYGADAGIRFRAGLLGTTLGFTVTNLGGTSRMRGSAIERRLNASNDPQLPIGRPIDIDLRTERLQLPTSLHFGTQTEVLGGPESLMGQRFGAAHGLALMTDITDGIDTGIMPALAAEYSFRGRFFARGGGRFLNDDRRQQGAGISYTAGAGIAVPFSGRRFLLDFGWRGFGELGGNTVVSFQFGS